MGIVGIVTGGVTWPLAANLAVGALAGGGGGATIQFLGDNFARYVEKSYGEKVWEKSSGKNPEEVKNCLLSNNQAYIDSCNRVERLAKELANVTEKARKDPRFLAEVKKIKEMLETEKDFRKGVEDKAGIDAQKMCDLFKQNQGNVDQTKTAAGWSGLFTYINVSTAFVFLGLGFILLTFVKQSLKKLVGEDSN